MKQKQENLRKELAQKKHNKTKQEDIDEVKKGYKATKTQKQK